MTICGKNCNKTVYSYKNNDYVIRRDQQNVTSKGTPSGPLIVLGATRYSLF